MSALKVILGGLLSLTAICSLIYYFTWYPNSLSSPPVPAPASVTVYIQATPLPTATPPATLYLFPPDKPEKKHIKKPSAPRLARRKLKQQIIIGAKPTPVKQPR